MIFIVEVRTYVVIMMIYVIKTTVISLTCRFYIFAVTPSDFVFLLSIND